LNKNTYKYDILTRLEKTFKSQINQVQKVLTEYKFLHANQEYFEKILDKIQKSHEENKTINIYSSNLLMLIYKLGYSFNNNYLKAFQNYYPIFQISVFIIVVIEAVSVYIEYKAKFLKVLAHMLWILSGLFVILGLIVVTYLYIFGNFNISLANLLLDFSYQKVAPETKISSCYYDYDEKNFYLEKSEAENLDFIPYEKIYMEMMDSEKINYQNQSQSNFLR